MINLSSPPGPTNTDTDTDAPTTTHHQVPEWEGQENHRNKQRNLFNKFLTSKIYTTIWPTPTKEPQSQSDEPSSEFQPTTTVTSFSGRFNRQFPPDRRYFGRSRRFAIFCALGVLFLLILVLALGLGLGLKHGSHQNLPLPSNTGIFTGDLTYYAPGLGACGVTSSSSDSICAVSHIIFDAASSSANPNANPLCGRKIRIQRFDEAKGGNRSVDVTVVDRCTGCQPTDLDLSLDMFEQLAEESLGRVVGSWAWLQ